MKIGRNLIGKGALLYLAAASLAFAQQAGPKPVIDPEAETVLQQLSKHNKQVKTAVFRVYDTIDDVQPDGRKIQFAHVRELTILRPDKLKVVTNGDVTNRTLWLDGKKLTVLERDKNVYAELPSAGTIDATIDMLQEKFGMSLPASDFLSDDVYKAMTDGCDEINYIGIGQVGELKCHHLAFRGGSIDWQLWVTTGDEPAAQKLVITYKALPGEPQYTMQLLKTDTADKLDAAAFSPEIPKDAVKIDFQPVNSPQ